MLPRELMVFLILGFTIWAIAAPPGPQRNRPRRLWDMYRSLSGSELYAWLFSPSVAHRLLGLAFALAIAGMGVLVWVLWYQPSRSASRRCPSAPRVAALLAHLDP